MNRCRVLLHETNYRLAPMRWCLAWLRFQSWIALHHVCATPAISRRFARAWWDMREALTDIQEAA